ncbi:MAG: hypothetical protein RBU27_14640 [Bacteroidota bacterium]|nr:hypothetical protein [Bacteroidota bacterium]
MRLPFGSLLLIAIASSLSAQTWTWTSESGAHPAVTEMRNGGVLVYSAPKEDVLSEWQTLPFPFTFAGEAVAGYFISDNGYITFDSAATTSESDNTAWNVRGAIFAYWDDFHLEDGHPAWSNEVRTKTDGVAPNRVHVVMWISVVPNGQVASRSNASFAIILHEQGGFEIEFVAGRGTSLLAGSIGAVNTDATVVSLLPDSPRIPYPDVTTDPNDDIRYVFTWSDARTDAAISALDLPVTAKVNEAVTIRGTVRNFGATPLTRFSLTCLVDDDTLETMLIHDGVSILTNETWDFDFGLPFTPVTAGHLYGISVSIALDDGSIDENPVNDTRASGVFCILGISAEKRVLVEEFTGAWCGWCPDGAVEIDKLTQAYPLAIPVALHSGGVDAMITLEGAEIARTYNPSYPTAMIDRTHFAGEPSIPIARTRSAWITRTEEQFAVHTPLSVSVTGMHDLEAFGGYVDVDVEFSDFAPPADYRIHCWLLLDEISGRGTGWDQRNYFSGNPTYPDHPYYPLPDPVTEYVHRHVPIQMLTGAWGVPDEIPDLPQAAATYGKRFHFTQTGITESSRLLAVAFVTRHSDDILDRPILNAAVSELRVSGIATPSANEFHIQPPYPQPASSVVHTRLTSPAASHVRLTVIDLLGRERLVVRDGHLEPGSHGLSFSTSGLESGHYLLRVLTDGYAKTTPLLVLH